MPEKRIIGNATLYGCEIDPQAFDIAVKRIEDAQRVQDMFGHDPRDAYEQTEQQASLLGGL